MAGTIPLSMTQQFDIYGQPLAGGQLFIIQAGTVSTPQNAYQDTNLTVPLPYPIPLDAAGRIPQFFLADASSGGNSTVAIRLQDARGVVQFASNGVLVIGPSGGSGGGGVTTDPATIFQTGDIKPRYGVGVHPGTVSPGWVRCNGLTIGSATANPSATERGNADCQPLFQYLWGADSNLVIVGGRGLNALADWNAGRTLTLPDWRGYVLGALDDMGNVAAGRLTAAYFGAAATILGQGGGSQSQTLAIANLNSFTPVGSFFNGVLVNGNAASHVRNLGGQPLSDLATLSVGNSTGTDAGNFNSPVSGQVSGSISINPLGSGTPHGIVSPTKLCTFYIKL